jgi:uncharacterized protein YggT (Ycf19 family)
MSEGRAKSDILRVTRVFVLLIYAVVLAYVVILSVAFVLQLLGASPTASFVDWIYRASARIMQPFRGMFPTQQVTSTSVFNASLLFAVIVYSLLGMLLHGAVTWLAVRIDELALRRSGAAAAPPAFSPATATASAGTAAGAPGGVETGIPRPSPGPYR